MNPIVSENSEDRCARNIVVRTAMELQKEVLNHYATKTETPDPAICFYLGLNHMSGNLILNKEARNWKQAISWLQKAAQSGAFLERANVNLDRIRKCKQDGALNLRPSSFAHTSEKDVLNAMNQPQEYLELGSVDFSNRTVTFKLPLYNSLHWIAGPASRLEQALTIEEVLNSAGMAGPQGDVSSISEWMSRTSAEVTSIKQHLQTDIHPETLIRAATVAGFKGAWPEFWAYRLETGLRQVRAQPENSKLSLSRFEKKYVDWIWVLGWLRFTHASSTEDQQIMDFALQTLNIAYKQTERHNPHAHRTLYLAWSGYIYFYSGRLEDLLYYPYDENMLPAKLPCQAVLDYASRLQAIQKLERPQLKEENAAPVVHHPRQKLLFGDGTILGTQDSVQTPDSQNIPSSPAQPEGRPLALVVPTIVLGLGALIVLAAAVILVKRRGGVL
ncbi:MAG: hypothetical protein QF473_18510 [Planctomycetota bacterium]|jgi:hypothetical protein|nr:hypothetical protein [Planctomycetota bacterium]